VRKVKKEILYKVRALVPGDIFGYEEFIKEDDMESKDIKREFRVSSIVHSEVIYIKRHEFLNCKLCLYKYL